MTTGIAAKIIRAAYGIPESWDGPYTMEATENREECLFFTYLGHILSIYTDGSAIDQFYGCEGNLISHKWEHRA